MKIPIINIYYLLCYAWNILPPSNLIKVGESDFNKVVDLLAKLMINGCEHLFKRGLDRNYVDSRGVLFGIKGKIHYVESIKSGLIDYGCMFCEFDEFHYDVIQNQILKSTLHKLMSIKAIDSKLKIELNGLYKKFHDVQSIGIVRSDFEKVKIHRNNSYYRLLINISRLIFENITIDENAHEFIFTDFTRDENKMAMLFQHFVRNFYAREQSEFMVSGKTIEWRAHPLFGSNVKYLPEMHTDIYLESKKTHRKIIIDTKYYSQTLKVHFEKESIISAHLFQIYAYLKNYEPEEGEGYPTEGFLLYPTISQDVKQHYLIDGHKISVVTIDLNKPWKDIELNLKRIILCDDN